MLNVESVLTLFRGAGWGVYLPPPSNFCHKIRTAIDFSRNFLPFNFYGHNMRSLRYVSRCFVEGR